MAHIRLIKENDIPTLKYIKLGWDAEINGIPYQVIKVEGFVHTIGGTLDWGTGNDFWCYPLNEELTYDNLRQYNGIPGGVAWGIKYLPHMYQDFKWDPSIESCCNIVITRNGKDFYSEGLTLLKAVQMIKDKEFDEHPLNLNERDFDTRCIGRKIWWRSQPGKISSFIAGQACIIIEPDGIDRFEEPAEFIDDDMPIDSEPDIKTSIFDKHIWWWRDDD